MFPFLLPSEPVPLLRAVHGETDIAPYHDETKDQELHEKPAPTSAFTVSALLSREELAAMLVPVCKRRRVLSRGRVQVLRLHTDNVVVVRQLSRLRAESQICHRRQLDVWDLKARRPLILLLVHQIHLQALFEKVPDLRLGGDLCIPQSSRRTSGQLVGFPIRLPIVRRLSVSIHGHDIGEDHAGSVVFVGIEENGETFELVLHAKHRSHLCPIFRDPYGHAVSEQTSCTMNFELELDFPIVCREWHSTEQPAGLRGVVACESDVLVCADNGAASKVPPARLHVLVDVWLAAKVSGSFVQKVRYAGVAGHTACMLCVRRGMDLMSDSSSGLRAPVKPVHAASSTEATRVKLRSAIEGGDAVYGWAIMRVLLLLLVLCWYVMDVPDSLAARTSLRATPGSEGEKGVYRRIREVRRGHQRE